MRPLRAAVWFGFRLLLHSRPSLCRCFLRWAAGLENQLSQYRDAFANSTESGNNGTIAIGGQTLGELGQGLDRNQLFRYAALVLGILWFIFLA